MIFGKLYIVCKGDRTETDNPLGWGMGIKDKYTPKQEEKKKERQSKMLHWAFCCYSVFRHGLYAYKSPNCWWYKSNIVDKDHWMTRTFADTMGKGGSIQYKHYQIVEPATVRLAARQPEIIDNIPLEGFSIDKTISRYSTSNKLWRINDPRGFPLEISTEKMFEILLNGEVKNGTIVGKYYWDFGKNGIGRANLVKYEGE